MKIRIANGSAYDIAPGENVFRALRAQRVFIPTICGGNGFCGQCKIKVASGSVPPPNAKETQKLTPAELAAGYRLSCQLVPENDIAIELPEAVNGVMMYDGTVTEAELVSRDIRRVRIALNAPATLRHLPGAYVLLDIPRAATARSYSVATPPSSENAIEINVKLVPGGIGSGYVHNTLKPGDALTFTAPYGGYAQCADANPLICVAGGSGISPVISILRHIRETGAARKIVCCFGAKTSADLPYLAELREYERTLPDFKFVPVVETPAPGENYETGLITAALSGLCHAGFSAYLCGGPGMVAASADVLRSCGIPGEKIFFDKFG